jgi:hypothetical protein
LPRAKGPPAGGPFFFSLQLLALPWGRTDEGYAQKPADSLDFCFDAEQDRPYIPASDLPKGASLHEQE